MATQAGMKVTVWLICLNAAAVMLTASGVAADLGISADTVASQEIQDLNDSMEELATDASLGETLFNVFTSGIDFFQVALTLPFEGPSMLIAIGLPVWLVGFAFAPQYLVVGTTAYYILSGREL